MMTENLCIFYPEENPILGPMLDNDSYKDSHHLQIPPGTTEMVSYIEARGYDPARKIISPEIKSVLDRVLNPDLRNMILNEALQNAPRWDHTMFFGPQMILKRWFSQRVTRLMVKDAARWHSYHGEPFPEADWIRVVERHGGYVPVRVDALPEGTVSPLKIPLVRVISTDPELAYMAARVETALHRVWYPTTVPTQDLHIKLDLYQSLMETSDFPDAVIPFMLHDFGSRGVSSQESAGIGGASHLLNFMGTDTTAGIHYAQAYYNEFAMPGFSIPAAEHSTITSWGGPANEHEAFGNMIDKFGKPNGIFAVVSDSYDIYNAVQNLWGGMLKSRVEGLGKINCRLVVRPDSGDPTVVPIRVIESLGACFGYTVNSKGYKVLPSYVRAIQGDGVNQRSIRMILSNLKAAGWSTENLAFGMGGAMLQQVDRDTLQFAMKTCSIRRNGEIVDVFKQPKTDPGKNSKRGDQAVIRSGPIDFQSIRRDQLGTQRDALRPIWYAGDLLVDESFGKVRERAQEGFKALYEKLYG